MSGTKIIMSIWVVTAVDKNKTVVQVCYGIDYDVDNWWSIYEQLISKKYDVMWFNSGNVEQQYVRCVGDRKSSVVDKWRVRNA